MGSGVNPRQVQIVCERSNISCPLSLQLPAQFFGEDPFRTLLLHRGANGNPVSCAHQLPYASEIVDWGLWWFEQNERGLVEREIFQCDAEEAFKGDAWPEPAFRQKPGRDRAWKAGARVCARALVAGCTGRGPMIDR